jgi:ABC-type glutathione transport system ATPase component
MSPALGLRALRVELAGAPRPLIDIPALDLDPTQITALVGASGAGKSLLGRALVGLIALEPGVVSGTLLTTHGPIDLRDPAAARRAGLGWLAQDGRAALVPQWRVRESLRRAGAPRSALAALGLDPDEVGPRFPHELSGGMAQRVQLALWARADPPLLIADEVTTGLDPAVAHRVLGLLRARADRGRGCLLITHDLGLVLGHADRVLCMDAGALVDDLLPGELGAARSPGLQRLIGAARRLGATL